MEVLGYIFILTAAEELGFSSWRLYERKYLRLFSEKSMKERAPFAFLRVCIHWRAVAQATPQLWTSFDATLHDVDISISKSIAAMDRFFSICRPTPMDIVLETDEPVPREDPLEDVSSVHAVAVLPILAKEAHRWRSASFYINHHIAGMVVDLLLNQFNETSLPNLSRLEIAVYSDEAFSPVKDLYRAIGTIKSIRELSLKTCHDPVPLLLSDIPWGQLTTVNIGTMLASDEIASILALSISIITASFTLVDDRNEDADPDVQRCTLRELKNLSLNGVDSMLDIFHRINFPNLERLDIRSSSLTCNQLLQWLTKQPNSPIRYLVLTSWDGLSEDDLADWLHLKWLRQVPHVEFHSWNCTLIVAGAVARLKVDQDAPVVWSWGPTRAMLRIGWKTQFDRHDGPVTRIAPSQNVAQ